MGVFIGGAARPNDREEKSPLTASIFGRSWFLLKEKGLNQCSVFLAAACFISFSSRMKDKAITPECASAVALWLCARQAG